MSLQITILLITASINAVLSLFVLFGTKTRTNLIYSIFVLFVALWAIGLAFFIIDPRLNDSIYIANFYYAAAAGIPAVFLYFSLAFLNKNFRFSLKNSVIFLPVAVLTLVYYFDKNFIIKEIFNVSWGKDVSLNYPHYTAYTVYFLLFVFLSYYYLVKNYVFTKDLEERLQIRFVVVGTSIAFILGMVFNLFLPFGGSYQYIWLGPVFTLIMVVSIGYAIARHHLFDIKVIATELLTFGLWIFIFVRILLADNNREQLVNAGLLFVMVIFGILLIRSVLREVKTREKIEKLAGDLEKANERLKELDQLKSEFVSLATHQIRGPLTAIKGYASMMIEGDYGEVPRSLREPIDIIFQSSQSLSVIVEDFLNVSRIEQGKMKYDFTVFDWCALVNEAVNEARPNIEKKGLFVSAAVCPQPVNIRADRGKIKQVVGNLLDNAAKYTSKGSISVSLTYDKDAGKATLAIKDTGIGIRPETMSHLFQKFSRAEDASKVNILGTGLGLYVAREMIKAHHGRVFAESEGEGKGSAFFVELASV